MPNLLWIFALLAGGYFIGPIVVSFILGLIGKGA